MLVRDKKNKNDSKIIYTENTKNLHALIVYMKVRNCPLATFLGLPDG